MLEHIFDILLPILIHIFELMGVIVLTVGAFTAFYHYVKSKFGKEGYSLKYQFANSMITALEFKLAAEILKTVLVKSLDELIILGALFLIRALMTFVLEREIKDSEKHHKNALEF
ncbi:DUF1622 domain-containing protein [uncultured Clostridium sp.]|uniref:DUF1622 domain-containing protein n=1 Tax=uncultured Clostridium sp. TaxID=59620 RepID=UPI0025D8AE8B|nr:DUF1622 domain-containing protein [uncultured Clostridium sp.]